MNDERAAEEFEQHYLSSGDITALDDAVRAWSRVLAKPTFFLRPKRARSDALDGASRVLSERYMVRRDINDLDRAIALLQQSVADSLPDSYVLPARLNNLAAAFSSRFEHCNRMVDLEESIRLFRQALAAAPRQAGNLAARVMNLGSVLGTRAELSGRMEDLEEVVEVHRQALEAAGPDSPDLPACLCLLGNALRSRFHNTGEQDDVEEAIQLYLQALRIISPDSPDWHLCVNNLGAGLMNRFHCTGRDQDLEEAIRMHRMAAETTSADSPNLCTILRHLAMCLHARFQRSRRLANLEEAIDLCQRAVDLTPPGSPDWLPVLNTLANAVHERYRHTDREDDLQEVVGVCRQVVAGTPPNSPHFAGYLSNLGLALNARFERLGREEDLDEAIQAGYQAVECTTADSPHLLAHLNNLGVSLRRRYDRMGSEHALQECIRVRRRACELGGLTATPATLTVSRNWGNWAFERQAWAEAVEAYGFGLAVGTRLLARQSERAHKEDWLHDLREISVATAYALAKLARYEEAALTTEKGRARLLGEALHWYHLDLDQLPAQGHADLHRRFRELVQRQEKLGPRMTLKPLEQRSPSPGSAQYNIRSIGEFEEVVAAIRQVPGYEDFLAEPTFAEIEDAASITPLAYLLVTSVGGLALVVHSGGLQPVWLDNLRDTVVEEWLFGSSADPAVGGWFDAYRNWKSESTRETEQAWWGVMEDLTAKLWSYIMEPLAQALQDRSPTQSSVAAPTVTLIPTGLLALLPLHAAWTGDASTPTGRRYFLDEFAVNYAPSARGITHARAAAEHAASDCLLAVEEPLCADASSLPSAHAEVAAIAALFEKPVILKQAEATRRNVLNALTQAQVVHLACHGRNTWKGSGLESGLLMADEEEAGPHFGGTYLLDMVDEESGTSTWLTIRHLLASGQAVRRLATLSACETGIIGTNLPDEVVGLPSALLQVGFGGVASSLWSVADISTAMLMTYFYRCWRESKLPPAQALRAAQRWVRDTTNLEKAEYFRRYSPELAGTRVPETDAVDSFLQLSSKHPDDRFFAHPFWWAAFYLTGS